jgi:SpoVK/Ycf46/Vps4 family AAA+-type ATPase
LYPSQASLTVQISAGELPTDAAKLEGQLSRIFKTASHWNAILLLDEADVFLEQRSPDNLTRNGLVSVFLRKLEYCQGIIFLTTNRVSKFDEAILSRIHLMLRYDDLTKDAREQVWRNFLSWTTTASGDADVTGKELDELAIYKLNGRQVCYLTESPAFVSLTSFSDKEYHVCGSGFRH